MREGTLWLFYFSKYLELIFLIVLTVLMFIEGIGFMRGLKNNQDVSGK
jgi:hypothetical protein